MEVALLDRLLSSGATVVLLALAFYPLERAFAVVQSQRPWRASARTDYAFLFGQHLLFGGVAVSILTALLMPLHALLPQLSAHAPVVVVVIVSVILGDLLVYGGHRLQHRVPLLWRFHAVHHTSTELDWVAAHREHPLDGLFTQTLMNLPAVLLGLDVRSIMGLVVFRGIWAMLIHANVRLPLGPLRWLLGAPEFHRWHHHKVGPGEPTVNFGNLAPWIDVLFGTHHHDAASTPELGIDVPAPRGYLGLLWWPFARREPDSGV